MPKTEGSEIKWSPEDRDRDRQRIEPLERACQHIVDADASGNADDMRLAIANCRLMLRRVV